MQSTDSNKKENIMAKRVGVYIFNGAEIVDWAGPMGVFAVARRMDPELDVFLVADSLAPVMATANLSVNPRYGLDQAPDMDAFLIPGGIGTRAEMHNGRLLDFVKRLSEKTLLVSVCTGSWVYAVAGLLDGKTATNRKNGDFSEKIIPIDPRRHRHARGNAQRPPSGFRKTFVGKNASRQRLHGLLGVRRCGAARRENCHQSQERRLQRKNHPD
jgi:putative intracellular protease/amidase